MTTFPDDDSDHAESHCVESYSSTPYSLERTMCLIDCATTHVILTDKRFFTNLEASAAPANIKTVGGMASIARGGGRAQFTLPNGTLIQIEKAIDAPTASRDLLSFLDLRRNGLHITTATLPDSSECLRLVNNDGTIVEECKENGNGLYFTYIEPSAECAVSIYQQDSHIANKSKSELSLWHDRLGHPGRNMFKRMSRAVSAIPLKTFKIAKNCGKICAPCAMGKLQHRPKVNLTNQKIKPREILDTLVSDVCGPISPPSGPFNYYMILKDSSGRYAKVHLLTSRNEVMPKLLISIIQLKAKFPEYPIRNVRVDNASEYLSTSFQEFCTSSGINLETSVPYAHNTSAENFVKQIQMVARPILLRSNLPLSCWGHAVLHAGDLIHYRPSSENGLSPYELVHGFAPSVAHLKIFGSAVYVPIPPHQRTKMGPQRQLGICGISIAIHYPLPEPSDWRLVHSAYYPVRV